MGADALAPCIVKSTAAMVLTMQDKQILVFNVGVFPAPVPSEMIENPNTGLILGLRPANERWRYFVTMSLIGWAQG